MREVETEQPGSVRARKALLAILRSMADKLPAGEAETLQGSEEVNTVGPSKRSRSMEEKSTRPVVISVAQGSAAVIQARTAAGSSSMAES